MESTRCLYILVSFFLISVTQQQALFTETQQQQLKDDKLLRKISEQLWPLVDEYATHEFNNAMFELRQTFLTEIDQLSDEINNLAEQAAQVEEAMKNMTRGHGVLGCPKVTGGYYHLVGQNCYMFNDVKKTWYEAKEWCVLNKGHLARPTTFDINQYLKNECRVRGKQYWIGGHDTVQEGVWLWDNGDPIPSIAMDWAPGEPNNYGSGQDCLGIGQDQAKQWDDKSCNHNLEFACQTAAVYQLR
ncbi:perlucin-like [Mizuhopecten yessoensis]|uniref:C-type lectin domain family 4 member K n=1 Tax=Mizuhopecten yessoensis TaxID=6573 RepID=A0A210Q262_MIZYE|nr:perlucin-like [Mizuhopecten yessoensis]OWF42812.1 C-type lectin domain family 4 member K [Mizuhopecten yessoensis]